MSSTCVRAHFLRQCQDDENDCIPDVSRLWAAIKSEAEKLILKNNTVLSLAGLEHSLGDRRVQEERKLDNHSAE